MRKISVVRTAAAISAVSTAVLISWVPPATADALPFTDLSAKGSIGFCDKAKHPITSGKIGAAPFVWTAVASVPAPSGYEKGKATLDVYQPRKDVNPGDWSGKQMTAASTFTNATYPMAQSTGLDPALVDFTSAYAPNWDGLVQLRLYFTAPNKPQHSIPYPAAVVRVTGETWTMVQGASVPCDAGSAVSVETLALPSSVLNSPTARSTPGAAVSSGGGSASTGASHSASPGSSSTRTGASAAAPSEDGSPSEAAAASDKKSGSSSGAVGWIVFAIVAVAAGAVGLWRWRRAKPA